ncbi:hypothetical protein D3C78_1448940 [compost metagenome]
MQRGAGEGVGQALLDHQLAGLRFQAGDEVPARALRVEQAAGNAEVAHVHHRGAEVARGVQQGADLGAGRVDVRQLQDAAAVFLLGVDDQQGRLAQGGWGVTTASQLEQGLGIGHGAGS